MKANFLLGIGSFLTIILLGCGGDAATKSTPAQAGAAGLHFQFSKAATAPGGRDKDNWCYAQFPEPVVITADPITAKNRVFTLGNGVHKVVVDFGKLAASFLLRKQSNGVVEIFTNQQFPECLSNQTYFTIAPDGYSFQYDNKFYINFAAELKQAGEGWSVTLNFPLEYQYGITVYRMKEL